MPDFPRSRIACSNASGYNSRKIKSGPGRPRLRQDGRLSVPAMATWQEFTLNLVQTAIFTPEYSAFASGRAVGTVLTSFRERFDGEMQVLPLPADVPPEITRVLLQSSDGKRRLAMARARIDSVWQNTEANVAPSLASVVAKCADVQEQYVRGP